VPKTYPLEIRISVVQGRKEGHSWKEVKELIRQRFGPGKVPGQRQMSKWMKSSDPESLSRLATEELKRRAELEAFKDVSDLMPNVFWAFLKGADVGIMLAKWLLTQLESTLGSERFQQVVREYLAEKTAGSSFSVAAKGIGSSEVIAPAKKES